ncbi:hypothetical protein GCM10025867_29110 [Frondihabitans sucicola]|uniref:PH domain-containing protein n=1 Tax=Frondihabitans sucicola TaxID=1268041 RepID=A0ABM8GQE3_9MICO|nr:hypothetical protein [Frondihabitans sucicola]BDZ50670.1 hypothetical protein GCM10025867_29110 [Frondihabitans sucicola]
MSSSRVDAPWFEFDRSAWRSLLARQGRLIVVFLVLASPLIVFDPRAGFDPDAWRPIPIGWALVISALLMGGFGVGLVAILRAADRRVAIDLAGRRLRVGRTVVPFDEVDTANVVYPTRDGSQALSIRFGHRHNPHRRATVMLLRGTEEVLADDAKKVLLEALAECPIVRPSSPYDPAGEFASANFPGTLDQAGALAVVRHPPRAGEPLP